MANNKTCLITGGSGTIGGGLVESFANEGYEIHMVDAKEPEPSHSDFYFHKLDVSDYRAVSHLAEKIPTLDVLINNAGLADPDNGEITELSIERWEKVISTNLTGYFLFAKYFTPHLRKAKGNIVNICSTRALMSEPHNEAYAASKGGILALTHALANSLGPDIRINSISPGWIAEANADLSDESHNQHPAGRVGFPQDIAELALYLASEKASFITGANFVVDGGMTHKMIYQE